MQVEQLRQHFLAAAELPVEMQARNVVVYTTSDPEVIIVEFEYQGRVTTTGRSFTVSNIFVRRVRDGPEVASRDHHNLVVLPIQPATCPNLWRRSARRSPSDREQPEGSIEHRPRRSRRGGGAG